MVVGTVAFEQRNRPKVQQTEARETLPQPWISPRCRRSSCNSSIRTWARYELVFALPPFLAHCISFNQLIGLVEQQPGREYTRWVRPVCMRSYCRMVSAMDARWHRVEGALLPSSPPPPFPCILHPGRAATPLSPPPFAPFTLHASCDLARTRPAAGCAPVTRNHLA
jgi:hypothetical protein